MTECISANISKSKFNSKKYLTERCLSTYENDYCITLQYNTIAMKYRLHIRHISKIVRSCGAQSTIKLEYVLNNGRCEDACNMKAYIMNARGSD